MQAPPAIPRELQAAIGMELELEPEAVEVLRRAAWLGNELQDEVFVSYTTLILGLILTPALRWLRARYEHLEEFASVRLASKKPAPGRLKRRLDGLLPDGWPEGRQLLSSSVQHMLKEAEQLASETVIERRRLGVRHLLGACLFRTPEYHQKELEGWRLAGEEVRQGFLDDLWQENRQESERWRRTVGHSSPPETSEATTEGTEDTGGYGVNYGRDYGGSSPTSGQESEQIPGKMLSEYAFDAEATLVLRAAVDLAQALASQRKRRRVLTTNVLFFALAESGFISDPFEASRLFREILVAAPAPRVPYDKDVAEYLSGVSLPAVRTPPISPFSADENSLPWLSPNTQKILNEARICAARLPRGEPGSIGVLHLITALLIHYREDHTPERNRLARLGFTQTDVREAFYHAARRGMSGHDQSALEELLVGALPPTATEFSNDLASGDDRLDVRRFARSLAGVIATRKVEPPLSVGIFGDWGSGKSFFMELIQKELGRMTGDRSVGADGKPLFCEHIVPVRFNAWHYADANLWASLVHTVLTELEQYVTAGQKGEERVPLTTLLSNLELANAAQAEARESLENARRDRNEAEQALHKARREALEQASQVHRLRAKALAGAVAETVFDDENLPRLLKQAGKALGIDDLAERWEKAGKTRGEALALLDDSRLVAARSGSALQWLVRAPIGLRDWGWIAIALVAVPALGFAVLKWSDQLAQGLVAVSTALAEAGALLAWARQRLGQATKVLDGFDAVRARLERGPAGDSEVVRKAEAALAERETALKAAKAQLASAEKSLSLAEAEVRESTSVYRLARYLQERLEKGDYAKQLGIISTIRADFDRLGRLLKSRDEDGERKAESVLAGTEGALPRPVDRIVLYIDDLDRCPSERVIKVLEAIHLLLAMPLFVVVVGVDVRWVLSALHQQFPRQLSAARFLMGNEGNPTGEGAKETEGSLDGDRASALDYLEKIFQIPFWLPPMGQSASENLIAALVGGERPRQGTPPGETPRPDGETQPPTADQEDTPPPTDTTTPDREPDETPDSRQGVGETGTKEEEQRERAKTAAALGVGDLERRYMLELAGTVGRSPRRLKRFVNAYRVLKASCGALELEHFLEEGGERGSYRAALTLLAITTGAPGFANEILGHLHRMAADLPLEDLLGWAEEQSKGHVPNEAESALAALKVYQALSEQQRPSDVRDLHAWADAVARFTFRAGRL